MSTSPMEIVTRTQIVALVTAALSDFYTRDRGLFREHDAAEGVSERTMAGRIGFYLEMHRRMIGDHQELSFDLEYNRNFSQPKSIYSMLLQQRRNVVPDLIVHRRNSNEDNLLVIEFKKGTPPQSDRQRDDEKLRYFTSLSHEYRYRYGMYIELHPEWAYVELYECGRKIEAFKYQ